MYIEKIRKTISAPSDTTRIARTSINVLANGKKNLLWTPMFLEYDGYVVTNDIIHFLIKNTAFVS